VDQLTLNDVNLWKGSEHLYVNQVSKLDCNIGNKNRCQPHGGTNTHDHKARDLSHIILGWIESATDADTDTDDMVMMMLVLVLVMN